MPDVTVEIPGVGAVAFPDTMSEQDMNAAAKRLYDEARTAAPAVGPGVVPVRTQTQRERGLVESDPVEAFKAGAIGGLKGYVKGTAKGVGAAINPMTYVNLARQATTDPVGLLSGIGQSVVAAPSELVRIASQAGSDPEAFGEVMGEFTGAPAVIAKGPAIAKATQRGTGRAVAATGRVLEKHPRPFSGLAGGVPGASVGGAVGTLAGHPFVGAGVGAELGRRVVTPEAVARFGQRVQRAGQRTFEAGGGKGLLSPPRMAAEEFAAKQASAATRPAKVMPELDPTRTARAAEVEAAVPRQMGPMVSQVPPGTPREMPRLVPTEAEAGRLVKGQRPSVEQSIQGVLEEVQSPAQPLRVSMAPEQGITAAGREGEFLSSGRPAVTQGRYDELTTPPAGGGGGGVHRMPDGSVMSNAEMPGAYGGGAAPETPTGVMATLDEALRERPWVDVDLSQLGAPAIELPQYAPSTMSQVEQLRTQVGARAAGRRLRDLPDLAGASDVERTNIVRELSGGQAGLLPTGPQSVIDEALTAMSPLERQAYLRQAPNAAVYNYIKDAITQLEGTP